MSINPPIAPAAASKTSDGSPRRLLSIIVISRDDPEGLTVTLRSISSQTFRDYEVVGIIKGRSAEVDMRAWAFPAGCVREQKSSGISVAFNEALELASGTFVNFLNGGDSYTDETVLQRMVPYLEGDSMAIVAARAADRKTGVRIPRDITFMRRNLELISHQASFFRRSLFDAHGVYAADFQIRMDFEWMLRLPPRVAVCWLDETIVDFEGGGISSVRPMRSSVEELRALLRHDLPFYRLLLLCGAYLPMRLARHAVRRICQWLVHPKGDRSPHSRSTFSQDV